MTSIRKIDRPSNVQENAERPSTEFTRNNHNKKTHQPQNVLALPPADVQIIALRERSSAWRARMPEVFDDWIDGSLLPGLKVWEREVQRGEEHR